MAHSCAYGHEPSDSVKCRKFITQLRNCLLLKKDSATWTRERLSVSQPVSKVRQLPGWLQQQNMAQRQACSALKKGVRQ